jgi:hypothetical protein
VIIGVAGKMQAGKDSTVKTLMEAGFTRVSFADPLKQLALHTNPWIYWPAAGIHRRLFDIVEDVGWEAAKEHFPESRAFLQDLGLGARLHIDEDVWVQTALRSRAEHIAFSDVRFPNEWTAVKVAGGTMIRVERPGHEGDGHISERALDGFEADFTLVNDGTLDDLANATRAVLAHLQGTLDLTEILS